MYKLIGAGLAALLLVAACNRPVQGGRDTIDFVKAIAADSGSPEHVLLSGFHKPANGGDIYLIGTTESCRLLGQAFLECDMFENARGNEWGDGLKDFAGEEFDYIADQAFTPYQEYLSASGPEKLREAAVRLCISALQPNCNVSIYDLDGNQAKTPAKLIVLADPWTRAAMAVYGGVDLVLLLPSWYSLRSADYFAAGAVKTLAATGLVNTLVCGAEQDTDCSLAETAAWASCAIPLMRRKNSTTNCSTPRLANTTW